MSIFAKIDNSMNKILSLIKQCTGKRSSNLMFEDNQSANNNQNNNLSTSKTSQTDLITSSNFLSSHLCNRHIRDLALLQKNSNDFDRLRSCYILTMTDLIGRYLIHRTPDDFRQFLIGKVQCTEAFTEEILQLIDAWSLHHLQVGRDTRTITLQQYL